MGVGDIVLHVRLNHNVGKGIYRAGAVGMRANTISEFEEAFKKAINMGCPVVIDTLIDKDEFVLPMLPPGGSIDDIIVEKGESKNG